MQRLTADEIAFQGREADREAGQVGGEGRYLPALGIQAQFVSV